MSIGERLVVHLLISFHIIMRLFFSSPCLFLPFLNHACWGLQFHQNAGGGGIYGPVSPSHLTHDEQTTLMVRREVLELAYLPAVAEVVDTAVRYAPIAYFLCYISSGCCILVTGPTPSPTHSNAPPLSQTLAAISRAALIFGGRMPISSSDTTTLPLLTNKVRGETRRFSNRPGLFVFHKV